MTTSAPTVRYTLSLHDALPIYGEQRLHGVLAGVAAELLARVAGALAARDHARPVSAVLGCAALGGRPAVVHVRSEEHTSELQSRRDLVCRLLLEKKNRHMSLST